MTPQILTDLKVALRPLPKDLKILVTLARHPRLKAAILGEALGSRMAHVQQRLFNLHRDNLIRRLALKTRTGKPTIVWSLAPSPAFEEALTFMSHAIIGHSTASSPSSTPEVN
jgi:hypothetical protein